MKHTSFIVEELHMLKLLLMLLLLKSSIKKNNKTEKQFFNKGPAIIKLKQDLYCSKVLVCDFFANLFRVNHCSTLHKQQFEFNLRVDLFCILSAHYTNMFPIDCVRRHRKGVSFAYSKFKQMNF